MLKLERSGFIRLLKTKFPEIKNKINAQKGSLGFEVKQYTLFVQCAISQHDEALVKECFQIASFALEHGNKKLRDAIVHWFLDDLDVFGRHSWARYFLGSLLETQLAKLKDIDGRLIN
jgi:hypothetical protein